ncbi:very long chain fatty acid elongase 7-like [Ornithodoros turicata]|uniref:very long chain fatty acid elongase 7-like n=1 Tax=Ornithodoros turicata TaxID=34597 RepID=UPI003138DC76
MSSLVGSFFTNLGKALSRRDPRTQEWILVANPTYVTALLMCYLLLAKVWGPRHMQHRKPYQLKGVIVVYNLFHVVANIIFFAKIFYHSFGVGKYSVICQGLTYGTDYHSTALLNAIYWYVSLRATDLLDTVFFVLQKKFTHVSVLHVVHHTIVTFNSWLYLRIGIDGQPVLGICLNALVHVVMYSYYFLAAFGPSVRKHLWWKKYLTKIQIVQFIIFLIQGSQPAFRDCGYPPEILLITMSQVVLILVLFLNFYVQAYIKKVQAPEPGTLCTKMCFIQERSGQGIQNGTALNGTLNRKED